jgi:hypothetical protein
MLLLFRPEGLRSSRRLGVTQSRVSMILRGELPVTPVFLR